jgi:phosphoenolpyruvate carboxykinase (GTP)
VFTVGRAQEDVPGCHATASLAKDTIVANGESTPGDVCCKGMPDEPPAKALDSQGNARAARLAVEQGTEVARPNSRFTAPMSQCRRMESETTVAAAGAVGNVRRDPMAMLPFCGCNTGDCFLRRSSIQRTPAGTPRIFHLSWFRKDARGGWGTSAARSLSSTLTRARLRE